MEYFIPQNQETIPPSLTTDEVNPSAQKTTSESNKTEAPGTSTDTGNPSAQKTTSESTEAPGLTDSPPAETPVPILSTFIKVPVEALGNFDKGRADCWVELLKHASIIRHPQPH
ncbi:hypothetical protein MIMGU_mgv1a016633mg [Erythranthe guttata]|uniref:Uncharacterized protein n=2 Tax=Erythranthe guttata TaxID=4155 RepID=A0A022RB83_ERYGU|nr:hypothetical protein MIMGU_mgv1a016633mg [Erythranthe guttata]